MTLESKAVAEVVERQEEIIRLQSETINALFSLLMQHISTEEAGSLPCIGEINRAAKIRRELGQG